MKGYRKAIRIQPARQSRQVVVHLDDELLARLCREAEEHHMSLGATAERVLDQVLPHERAESHPEVALA